MKKSAIRIFFGIMLITLFSLKAGIGLSLHNYFHSQKNSYNTAATSKGINVNCSCLSDFYLPFTEISQQKICIQPPVYITHNFFYPTSLPVVLSLYTSLRAPPFTC